MRTSIYRFTFLLQVLLLASADWVRPALAQQALGTAIDQKAEALEAQVIAWRRDFHQHPELGNQELRTASIVAGHLRALGFEVTEQVAVTGVVGVLKGGKPGPTVALRADMDALPVTERVDVPFKSTKTASYNGQEVGVSHACGHDSHVAILMGVAETLASIRNELPGTVKFIFQPAEEGMDDLDTWGAKQMVEEGVMEDVDAIFGLHINSQTPVGTIKYRSGPAMAAVDNLEIQVIGKQAHGAYPWSSVDPIVTASQLVVGLQTIVSRSVNVTEIPAIVTIGSIHGGVRHNIIPEEVAMIGTIRTYSAAQQELVHRRIFEIAAGIAQSAGAQAKVNIRKMYPVTYNDPSLTAKMLPTLERVTGSGRLVEHELITGAEDFSFYQQAKPGLFVFLGGMPADGDPLKAPAHHTPDFYLDESGFVLGVKALSHLALDYLQGGI
ncbi:MAG: amidohydrolase [Lunatimonas sp.]|uniref:amidohydrolase n=1 Tax=Lunatimonas sp. TaxID=2060141 RepID=UPI00263A60D6|nr:amidohydrolase [Lunatimonas sp.]MCC5936196.1 amidohydrolase [Lunatimonas sp.]